MAKGLRKGKKAWRKNIRTDAEEAALEERGAAEQQGTAVGDLPDSDLFFIDKARDEAAAQGVAAGLPPAKRQRTAKPLRSQAILAAAHRARPVVHTPGAKPRRRLAPRPATTAAPAAAAAARPAAPMPEELDDLWAEPSPAPALEDDFATEAAELASGAAKRRALGAALGSAPKHAKRAVATIPAVEVAAPGCSYNPDRGQHQDAVAAAVAAELRKEGEAGLRAGAPPRLVDWQPPQDELAGLQVDAEPDSESEEADTQDACEPGALAALRAAAKKTTTERNKERRKREAARALEARQRHKRQRRELACLKAVVADIAVAEAAAMRRAARRAANAADRAASQPPRLGKRRYQAAPVQVLLSREITGSLRKLRPASMLAKERFNSLQKRGIIEPRLPAPPRMRRRRKEFMSGQRADNARERAAAKEL